MLTIAVGHSLHGICFCLGELAEVPATRTTRRTEVLSTDDGQPVLMTAEDQIALSGRLASGAVVSLHYRGGLAPAPGLRWEIQGTDGRLVVTGASGHLQYGRVELAFGAAGPGVLRPRRVPASYEAPELQGARQRSSPVRLSRGNRS